MQGDREAAGRTGIKRGEEVRLRKIETGKRGA